MIEIGTTVPECQEIRPDDEPPPLRQLGPTPAEIAQYERAERRSRAYCNCDATEIDAHADTCPVQIEREEGWAQEAEGDEEREHDA